MAQVKRFTLVGALSAGTDVFVAGAGLFRQGVLDIAVADASALAAVRAAAPQAVESGPLDNVTTPPPTPHGDPYPEYLKYSELVDSIAGGSDQIAQTLKSSYVPQGLGRIAGHRLVGLGDSITAADSYLRYLAALSSGRIRFAHNSGVGGDQITQMLARFDTDVTPYAPTMVSVMAGTNDYTFGATDTQFRAGVRSFVSKVRSIGAVPLLFTSPPCNVLADPDRAKIPRNNVWMAEYAARNGVLLVDAYAVLADSAQNFGKYQTGLVNADGIHPNAAGHWALAQAAWAVLSPLLPARPIVTATAADPTNLVINGLLKDGDGDGWADSWGQNWGTDSGTWTYSIVNDAQVPGGTMQRVSFTAASGRVQRNQAVTTGFAEGDTMRLTALVTTTATTAAGINVGCNGASGNIANPAQVIDRPMTRGLIDLTFVVPAGTTTLDVTLDGYTVGSNVTSTVDFGAVTLRNETALGLLAP
jgi:lysophospholipase L1-like esterase